MITTDQNPLVILTVGHSTMAIEEFLALLEAHGVKLLVDVRTIPRSRHNPQFNLESLPASLAAAGIEYTHLKGLGGLRHALKDSVNTGWRNASFRGYADYMQTGAFAASLAELMDLAAQQRAAIMCAEAVPWRCHRSLIADALLVHGARVEHITSLKEARPHELTPWAKADGRHITYPSRSR